MHDVEQQEWGWGLGLLMQEEVGQGWRVTCAHNGDGDGGRVF